MVAVFNPGEHATAPPPKVDDQPAPFLVELFPINMDSLYFKGEDMNAAGVRSGSDPKTGMPCVFYEVAADAYPCTWVRLSQIAPLPSRNRPRGAG